jgi:putative nucleotidyltransferase with HDIG domain
VTGSALHRVGQFWRHASARVSEQERLTVEPLLGPALWPLFAQLPVNDQRHGIDVLETVRRLEAQPDRLLQQAALLHDVGKAGAEFSVVDRSLTVFLRGASPRLLEALRRARPGFARRHDIYIDHARIGAERLRVAGAPELADVVAEHHAPEPRLEVTRRLQHADGKN